MKTIWKFTLAGDPCLSVHLPEGSRPIAARFQTAPYGNSKVQVWILIDSSLIDTYDKLDRPQRYNKQKLFQFFAFNTGQDISPVEGLRYLITVENPETKIIQHIFWRAS